MQNWIFAFSEALLSEYGAERSLTISLAPLSFSSFSLAEAISYRLPSQTNILDFISSSLNPLIASTNSGERRRRYLFGKSVSLLSLLSLLSLFLLFFSSHFIYPYLSLYYSIILQFCVKKFNVNSSRIRFKNKLS